MLTTRHTLIQRISNREDRAAWEEFDGIYRPLLRRYAGARGLRDAEVDDVVQEVMTQVYRHIPDFQYDPTKGRFKAWLKTIVNNNIRNRMRQKHESHVSTTMFEGRPASEAQPDEVFNLVWLQEHLRHCLELVRADVLPGEHEAFRRHVIEEWPVERVCAEFSLTAQQVYKLKWKLTERIRAKMTELLGENE